MPTPTLVEAHRRELLSLTSLAVTDLEVLFRTLTNAEDARDALMEILPQLLAVYGSAAASLAADWYDEVREADEVPGRFRAIVADLPDTERTDALARWGVSPLFNAEPDFATARAKVSGGLQRIVADAGRNTILRSIDADPQAGGWSRRTTSKSCDFCKMIEGRGAVYSAATADFSSHDDCDCVAVPAFGRVREVKPYVPSQRPRNAKSENKPDETRDVDADRTTEQLRKTLASLERSLEKFESPGTRKRVEDLRRKIAARN